jgi:hypothetical protein
MSDCGKSYNNPKPISVITAGCCKTKFTSSDIQLLVEFMKSFLRSAPVDKINEYFRENMKTFMELPILEVCSMIMNHFGILSQAMPDVLDFVMVSLMGYQRLTSMIYVIDGFFFKLKLTDDPETKIVDIQIESISPMDSRFDRGTTLCIQQKLGSGSYANVYLGSFQKDGESHCSNYALKFFTDKETGEDDFNFETDILSVLRGTGGVINVEFHVEISVLGKTFFAYGMPYFENGTLHDYSQCLSTLDIFNNMKSLAETMRRCHALGLFHCDIKPENILIDSSRSPVLADFGIAKHTGSKCWSIKVSSVRYSPHWRDPWNWREEKNKCRNFQVSILSELWALLLSILDCLSQRKYQNDPRFDVFRKGDYFHVNSQNLVNDAIDCIFPSDCLESIFFKKWLDIKMFMNLTTTIPENHPSFFDDRYLEFFYDLDLVINKMNDEKKEKPSETESSESSESSDSDDDSD